MAASSGRISLVFIDRSIDRSVAWSNQIRRTSEAWWLQSAGSTRRRDDVLLDHEAPEHSGGRAVAVPWKKDKARWPPVALGVWPACAGAGRSPVLPALWLPRRTKRGSPHSWRGRPLARALR